MSPAVPLYRWVLNPDAEREMSAKKSYAVRAAFMKRIAERASLFAALVEDDEFIFTHQLSSEASNAPESKTNTTRTLALFWCSTPHAQACAKDTGLILPPAPSLEILKKVHDKAFITTNLSSLAIPGRQVIKSDKEWTHYRRSTRGALRLKRRFAYAGKAQRVWPETGGEDLRWLHDSLRTGGFIAERNIEASGEVSLHGVVGRAGVILGDICALNTDKHGAPTGIDRLSRAEELPLPRSVLTPIAERVAAELLTNGYFGPFGIDILLTGDDAYLIDVNPRFTLGWSIGMGDKRAAGIERVLKPELPQQADSSRS